ncbi:MAG: HNH endonuclease [Deltaproteobacteria bacterium]|nr:HNH endonuclease [Deltaproteobacteria bacterium]
MSERRVPAELRRFVADRANRCCEYCRTQERYSSDPFAIDHINPRSRGGLTTEENLAFCCQGCNQHKSKRSVAPDPITDAPVPLFHPREQHWQVHFSWNGDFTLMVGLTSVGRATISALHLNRPGLVNLRRALYAIGEHPPRLTEEL